MVTHNVQPLPRPAGRYTIRLQVVSAGYKHEASMFVRAKVDTEKKSSPRGKKTKDPKGPQKLNAWDSRILLDHQELKKKKQKN